jgi:hypothetical protein
MPDPSRPVSAGWPPAWMQAELPPPAEKTEGVGGSPPEGAERPWPPRPPELAYWSPELRERWGRRANELEGRGVEFPESERRAFAEIKASLRGR